VKAHVAEPEPPPPPAPRPSPATPATIDGYVLNEETGWGIAFAVVKLWRDDAPALRVRADVDGRFHVPPPLAPGRYALEVMGERWAGAGEVVVAEGERRDLWIKVRPRPRGEIAW
jgi:hypothetical protein